MDPLWTWALDHFEAETRVIIGAPGLFIISVILASAVVYIILDRIYQVRIANLASEIAHRKSEIVLLTARVQDYKDKLSGKTPDEVRAQMVAYEERLAALEPRSLTQEQVQTITERVTIPNVRAMLRIGLEISVPDARLYGEGFMAAFQNAGWHVDVAVVTGVGAPPCGLGVYVVDPNEPTDFEKLVIDALRAANVEFEIEAGSFSIGHASIFVGLRRTR